MKREIQDVKDINKFMNLIEYNLYTVQLKRRKDWISGLIIHAGIEWLLLRYVPVDYIVDGYILIHRKHIKNIERNEKEIFKESVIKLKLANDIEKLNLDLDNTSNLLSGLLKQRTVIQFDFHEDDVCYIGKIISLSSKIMWVQDMDTKGIWVEKNSYSIERIRTIQFDNDYINSLVTYNNWLNK